MDKTDVDLIKLLEKDARQSSESLARKLNISAATARRRIRLLVKNGVIRIAAIIDPKKYGLPIGVVFGFRVEHSNLSMIMKIISRYENITWVTSVTGRHDVMAVGYFQSTEDLNTFIQNEIGKINGIKESETFISLHIQKGMRANLP